MNGENGEWWDDGMEGGCQGDYLGYILSTITKLLINFVDQFNQFVLLLYIKNLMASTLIKHQKFIII